MINAQVFLQNSSKNEEEELDQEMIVDPLKHRDQAVDFDDEIRFSLSEGSSRPQPLSQTLTIKERFHKTLEDPSYSTKAAILSFFMVGLVLISTVTFLILSYPQYQQTEPPPWLLVIEIIINTIFTIEWTFRFFTAEPKLKWFLHPLSLVDLVAFLPFWIDFVFEIGFIWLSFLRILRMFRFLRIFRIARWAHYSPMFLIMYETVKRSKPAFVLLVFLILMAVVIYSSLIFYAETIPCQLIDGVWIRPDGSVSPYQSIPATFWWCIVTLTGVGYGDATPITWYGRIIAACTMLSGVMTLAFPISLVGAEFSRVWATYSRKQRELENAKPSKAIGFMTPVSPKSPSADVGSHPQSIEAALSLLTKTCDNLNQEMAAMKAKQNQMEQATQQIRNLISIFEKHLRDTSENATPSSMTRLDENH
eukprot:TRINITY_DN6456_c0_g1_i2.p1 TRINITY_DN6456_c0_g1~~TRINITY_DN6456_c0_g1_i2.p1  ORF type:complete len:420 (-),score=69.94 TRINITY_DN6456_c0_g1_i2:44-1303(-)